MIKPDKYMKDSSVRGFSYLSCKYCLNALLLKLKFVILQLVILY